MKERQNNVYFTHNKHELLPYHTAIRIYLLKTIMNYDKDRSCIQSYAVST